MYVLHRNGIHNIIIPNIRYIFPISVSLMHKLQNLPASLRDVEL